jgi:hypothetical protein
MNFNRILSKLLGSVFILAGIGLITMFLYMEGIWAVRQFYWPSTQITVDSLNTADSGQSFIAIYEDDAGHTKNGIVYDHTIIESEDSYSDGLYEGKIVTALYDKNSPTVFYVVEGWWVYLIMLGFFSMLIVVGYFMVSTKAGLRLSKKFAVWNQGFRIGFGAFLLAGIAALIMSVIESLIFLIFGVPFSLVGGYGLYNFYKKRRKKQELLQTGRKIEIPNPAVEQDTLNSGTVLETGQFVYPFVIKCTVTLPENSAPLIFVSDLIWIDPQPYLKNSVTVYVNPANVKEYVFDLSFLPKDERTISQRSFTFR